MLFRSLHADERKQRQQHRLAEEIEAATRKREARQYREQLNATVMVLPEQTKAAPDIHALAACSENYLQWLLANQLNLLPGNLKTLNERAAWSHDLASADCGLSVRLHGCLIGASGARVGEPSRLRKKADSVVT